MQHRSRALSPGHDLKNHGKIGDQKYSRDETEPRLIPAIVPFRPFCAHQSRPEDCLGLHPSDSKLLVRRALEWRKQTFHRLKGQQRRRTRGVKEALGKPLLALLKLDHAFLHAPRCN